MILSNQKTKSKISVSLDEELIERLDELPGSKRSTVINEGMWEWLENNGY